jgi:tetratricopeptide (TPR) repeat protein
MEEHVSSDVSGETAAPGAPLVRAALAQIAAARLRKQALVASGRLPAANTDAPPLNRALPNYVLQRELHRGGQGVVYLATQESTGREVAVKILRRAGTDGAELARFQREVEALSRLKHPNVVTIHDCGRCEGDVYLVMDYVAGRPLDAYVAQEKPALRGALALFAKVCDGVNAAHLRGVIHRDLKPSNIRVGDDGEPRVLDFGLAKLEHDGPSAVSPEATVTGQFIGSLPWASPEQVEAQPDAMDIRSDVYSLGVLFYQLLTDRFPYPVGGRIDEVVHHITSTDPARPSWFDRSISADVETILLKCLAKEPERRYQGAGEVARDLRHFLAGDAIEARRDSMSYVLRRYLARRKLAVTGAAVVLLALLTSTALSWAYWRNAEAARADEHRQRTRAEAMYGFVTRSMTSSDPFQGGKEGLLVRDAMQEAAKSLQAGAFREDPRVEAGLALTISRILNENGRYSEALDLSRRALEINRATLPPDHPELAESLNTVALCQHHLGQYAEALAKFRETLSINKRIRPGDAKGTASVLHNMAGCLRFMGNPAAALAHYDDALEMRRRLYPGDHPLVAVSLSNSAGCLRELGRIEESHARQIEALAMFERLQADDHPDLAMGLCDAAVTLDVMGRSREAQPLHERGLAMRRRFFQGDHPETAQALSMLAYSLFMQERFAEGLAHATEAADMYRRLYPGDHRELVIQIGNIGLALLALGRLDEASARLEEAMAMSRRLFPGDNGHTAQGISAMASLRERHGLLEEALKLHEDALQMRKRLFGPNHPDVAKSLHNKGSALRSLHRHDEAEVVLEETLALQRRLYKDDHPTIARTSGSLAETLLALGRLSEAEPLARDAVGMSRRLFAGDSETTANSLSVHAAVLHSLARNDEAASVIREASDMVLRMYPPDHPIAKSILARRIDIAGNGSLTP